MRKNFRKCAITVMAMAVFFTSVNVVQASEPKTSVATACEQEIGSAARALKTVTFGDTKMSYTVGTMTKC